MIEIDGCNGILLEQIYAPATEDSADFVSVVSSGCNGLTLRSCRFSSVGDDRVPSPAFNQSTSAVQDWKFIGCVYDGGYEGWLQGIAYFEKAEVDGLFVESQSLLLGSSLHLHVDTVGWVSVPVATGESRVEWTSDP